MKITMEGRSQASKVLKWMADRGSITVATAGDNLRCFCLHKRIAELRADGWNVDSSGRLSYTNGDGARVTVAVHKLVEPWHPELAPKHPTEDSASDAHRPEQTMSGERYIEEQEHAKDREENR